MICKKCGTLLPDVARFCYICGETIEDEKEKLEKEAKEKAEKEAKEKAEKEAKEKAEKEAKEKAEKEAKEKAEKEAKEKAEKDNSQKSSKADNDKSKKDEDDKAKDDEFVEDALDEEESSGSFKIMVNPDYVAPVFDDAPPLFEEHIDYQAIHREKAERTEKIALRVGSVVGTLILVGAASFFGYRFYSGYKFDTAMSDAKVMYESGNYEGAISKLNENKSMYRADENEICKLMADVYIAKGENDLAVKTLLDEYNVSGNKEVYDKYLDIKDTVSLDKDDSKDDTEVKDESTDDTEVKDESADDSEVKDEDTKDDSADVDAQFCESLYKAVDSFNTTTAISDLAKIVDTEDFAKLCDSAEVTFYTQADGIVESVANGNACAVYDNGYIYFGSFKDGQRSGVGVLVKVQNKDDELRYTYYKGSWSDDLPNGKGVVTLVTGYGTDDVTMTVTTGTYKNGLEDGIMIRNKSEAGTKWGEMEYSVKEGVPQPATNSSGETVKDAAGNDVLGFHMFNGRPSHTVSIVSGDTFKVSGLK